jgi:3-dehydrotetronate 4-kinase
MTIYLGCIADDFTGATDLANTLVRAGMRVVQTIGVPDAPLAEPVAEPVDAVVVALKSRTVPAAQAVAQSLEALRWLQAQGAQQFYFKVCSTFDSTPQGNIGPVAEALMAALDCPLAVVTPAFPENARTVFMGHLFVGQSLLSDSSMRDHPLTPMRDASLVRVLAQQCVSRQVGLLDHAVVRQGSAAIAACLAQLQADGVALVIADAISNDDLLQIGAALKGARFMVGGSGLAIGLPRNSGLAPSPAASRLPPGRGLRAIVSGSCSAATLRQVRTFTQAGGAAFAVDPIRIAAGEDVAAAALQWAGVHLAGKESAPVLIYASAEAGAVQAAQAQLGVQHAGELVEQTLARVARGLVELGVAQLVVAGGETSGACVQALGIGRLAIGPQIDAGVPWCHAQATAPPASLHLALKSGNFGGDDFFTKAFTKLAAA